MKSPVKRGIWFFCNMLKQCNSKSNDHKYWYSLQIKINLYDKQNCKVKYLSWFSVIGDGNVHHSALRKRKQSSLLGGLQRGKLPSGSGMPQRCTQALKSNAELRAHQFKPLSAGINVAQLPPSSRCSSFMGSWKASDSRIAMHPADTGSLTQACSRLSTQALDYHNCVCVAMLSTSELFIVCIFLHCYCTMKTSRPSCHKSTRKSSNSQLSVLLIGQREKKKLLGPVCAVHVRKVQLAVSLIKN